MLEVPHEAVFRLGKQLKENVDFASFFVNDTLFLIVKELFTAKLIY